MRYSYRCRKWNERILKYTLCVEVEQYSSASMTEIRRRQRNSTPVQTLAEMQKMIDGAAQAYFRTIPGKWALIEEEIKRLDKIYWSIPTQTEHLSDDQLVDHMNRLSDLETHLENLEKRRDELCTFQFKAILRMMNAFFFHWHIAFIAVKNE